MPVAELLSTLCEDCSIESDNLDEMYLNFSTSGSSAYFTADLIYSNSEGTITSSTLIRNLWSWLLEGKTPNITISGNAVALNKRCPVPANSFNKNICMNLLFLSDITDHTNSSNATSVDHAATSNDHTVTSSGLIDRTASSNDHIANSNDHTTTSNDHNTTSNDHNTTSNDHNANSSGPIDHSTISNGLTDNTATATSTINGPIAVTIFTTGLLAGAIAATSFLLLLFWYVLIYNLYKNFYDLKQFRCRIASYS